MFVGRRHNYPYFELNFPTLIAISCILPAGGLIICVAWCLLFAFKQSTATECDTAVEPVWNFLPSVSAATGNLSPQKYIWRIAIALHVSPRFIIAAGYFNFYRNLFSGSSRDINKYKLLTFIAYGLHVVEISALMGLSFVSSIEDYDIHKMCFITFMICATWHMIAQCVLYQFGRKAVKVKLSAQEKLSLTFKKVLFVINIAFFVAALLFFLHHNKYCQNGAYSLFGLCEIVVIFSNIGFHATAMWDFQNSRVLLQDVYV